MSMMTKEIEQKIYDGDPISDEELLIAVGHFRVLCGHLDHLGERWQHARSESRRILDLLEGFERARREKR